MNPSSLQTPRELIISPSMLSCDFGHMADELIALETGGLKWVHWDVMDGAFVPNITLGAPVIKAVRNVTKLFFDVHLMVEKPERYIGDFVEAGADIIGVHAEATPHLERAVSMIRDAGVKTCVALNPHTPLDMIEYLLPELDMVLIMSVNPGFGGQTFLKFCIDKIRGLSQLIRHNDLNTLIQVDGGITPENIADVVAAGADVVVSGSAFFAFPPYDKRHELFQTLAHLHLGQMGF